MSRSHLGDLIEYRGGEIVSFLCIYDAQHYGSWAWCLPSVVTVSLLSQPIAGVNKNGRVELLVAFCAVRGFSTCRLQGKEKSVYRARVIQCLRERVLQVCLLVCITRNVPNQAFSHWSPQQANCARTVIRLRLCPSVSTAQYCVQRFVSMQFGIFGLKQRIVCQVTYFSGWRRLSHAK